MKLKTAIIGMGKMGKIRYNELIENGCFDIVAICDVNTKLTQEYKNVKCFSDWHEALKEKLDCVFVCTFNNVSPEIICESLNLGLHVFSEKPPGRNEQDIEKIIEAEKQSNGKILKFGFNHRFHYCIMKAKALVDSGRYGKIMWARGIYGKAGGLDYENSWRSNKMISGGGILLDQGIHMLDLLSYFLGDFVQVKSMVENTYWKNTDLEDNAFALLRTNEGQVAMLHSSATQWKHKFSLELYMENGFITINGILSSTRSYGEESITFAKKQFEDESSSLGKPQEETIYFDTDDSWKLEIKEFYDAVLNINQLQHGKSIDALKLMYLINRIYQND